eukprot:10371698-Karenia_brevis.AAC.1
MVQLTSAPVTFPAFFCQPVKSLLGRLCTDGCQMTTAKIFFPLLPFFLASTVQLSLFQTLVW